MAKFELTDLKDLKGQPITIGDAVTGEIIEIDPDSNSKYIFVLEMGNIPPDSIATQMKQWAAVLKDFLGENKVLLSARTTDQKTLSIYELKPLEEEHAEEHA